VAGLYRRYGYFVLRRCELVLRNRAAAEDALQEVFVRVLRHDQALDSVERPLGWLYRVADNVCFDQIRRRRVATAAVGELADVAGCHPSVQIEERSAALALLSDLDDRDRRICVLAFIDGMTQGQIADEIALSRVSVNKRIQFIRQRAARLLRPPAEGSA
jgi:RNA polymerase sigma-70 factor (ECF subfamily)